ncbi:MAG TPA: hypothetical protein PKN62_01835 [bacterium]|nr:hypothetical protein [bacterium]
MRKMLTIAFSAIVLLSSLKVLPATATTPFDGKILLAVEGKGEAWYINPTDSKRYYLGRPADAFQVMRALAIGISNTDFALLEKNQLDKSKVNRLLGRILLKPQDDGKAYYFEPSKRQLYYLGRPADAFEIMKKTAVGAADEHINPIPTGTLKISPKTPTQAASSTTAISPTAKVWRWTWNDQDYLIQLELTNTYYKYYQQQPKVFSYSGQLPSDWRDRYYKQFTTGTEQEKIINQIVSQLRGQATKNNLNDSQLAELAASFVQSIPYDQARSELIAQKSNQATPNYPYETLYLNKGVCTDKSLLAWMIFSKLGYGTALLSYPTANHMALGIVCPKNSANYGSGFCYLETTQYYRIGLIPKDISGQAASTTGSTLPSWQASGNLAAPEIYHVSSGNAWNGLADVKNILQQLTDKNSEINSLHQQIEEQKPLIEAQQTELRAQSQRLDELKAARNISEYNELVPVYNRAVQAYEQNRQDYNTKINSYNQLIKDYNQLLAALQPSKDSN